MPWRDRYWVHMIGDKFIATDWMQAIRDERIMLKMTRIKNTPLAKIIIIKMFGLA